MIPSALARAFWLTQKQSVFATISITKRVCPISLKKYENIVCNIVSAGV